MRLNDSQVEAFRQNGYLKIPQAIPEQMLQSLIRYTDEVVTSGFAALKQNAAPADFAFNYQYLQPFLNRLTQFHLHTDKRALAILGSPVLLDIAQSLCSDTFLPTVDMLILKNQYDDLDLPWHQDLIYDCRRYCVIAVGIYLDDAVAGDGALKLIKGSQTKRQDIDAMMLDNTLEVIEVPAKAGDILIHDPMLVHWSDRLRQQKCRRTLYYEFRPLAQVIEEECWPHAIIANRIGLMFKAIKEYQQQYPHLAPFEPHLPKDFKALQVPETLEKLYDKRIPFSNANFASSVNARLDKNRHQEDLP